MKGKCNTTEDKIRILREVDRSEKSVLDIRREENISEVKWLRPVWAFFACLCTLCGAFGREGDQRG